MNSKRVALWGVLAALGLAMILLLMASSPTPTARAAEFTVCTAGPPDCGYSSVQDAVFAARDGDLIKIAGGVYTGVWNWLGTNTTYLTATQMVVITQSLTLRGGYTVTNWTTPDPVSNPTTLDAQGQGRVLLISGAINPTIAPTIEGLRITGGNSDELGGQLYGEPWNLVADVGGGVYAVTATVTISNCEIANNVAAYDGDYPYVNRGGAIYVNSALNLINSRITDNTGDCTGGVYLDDVDYANIVSNEFEHNFSTGGNCYTGGGLYARGSDVEVRYNVFRDNSAYGGGGLTATGGAVVEGNLLEGNRAVYGGGIQIRDGAVTLNGNTVIGNNAQQAGGGISAFNGRPRALLVNNLIAGNTVSTWDGRPCGGLDGGSAVLAFADSVLTMTHNTIARNRFPTCADNAILVSGATVTLTNNIVVSHGLGITVTAGATATLDGTLWGAGDWANGTDWAGDGTILTGTTNIWGDPGFIDPDAGDYHISLTSAARDAGVAVDVVDDLDGELRPQGAGYDIGADEFPFCEAVTEIPTAECEALVALYNSTGGPNWTDNTGWLVSLTPCSWYGVTCSAGHVSELSLISNQLIGHIPAELGSLAYLQYLYLSDNQLSGSLLPELSHLANLQGLGLRNNHLSGIMPPELGSLVNLLSLDLQGNQLSGNIPAELGNLVNLLYLDLSYNQVSESIPAELGSLVNLRRLHLQVNQLSGAIPPELGNVAGLQYVHLGSNQLSGSIPPSLGNLLELGYLSLSDNQLGGGIPIELGELGNLRILLLAGNQLTGGVPTELGSLASLEVLELQANQLDGSIPEDLANLSNLQTLRLDWNQLSGIVPAELGNLVNLERLWLGNNQLSGEIPPELGQLSKLRILNLSDNQLSGPIPAVFGNLIDLEWLFLGRNQLSASIPSELGGLSALDQLGLETNQLEGDIPPELANLASLRFLGLGFNMLTASDPSIIAFLSEKAPGWADTQTVPPAELQAVNVSGDTVELFWEPITYTWDGGYYQVNYGTSPGGPYSEHGTTADKTASGYLADGLSSDTTHYFVVRTYTPAHDLQQNELWSGYSEEVSATTTVELGSLGLMVDLQGRSDYSDTLFTAWSSGQEAGSCISGQDGACSIPLASGTYSVTAEMASYLDSVREGVTVNVGETTNLPLVELPGGDTNDDCVVNIQDLAFMGYRFNACAGDPLYDVRGDSNADGCINILDLAMAGGNFNQACPVPW